MKPRNLHLLAILLLVSFVSHSQDIPTIGVGIVTERVDSSITKSIKIISTGIGNIVAFPAGYSIGKESAHTNSEFEAFIKRFQNNPETKELCDKLFK